MKERSECWIQCARPAVGILCIDFVQQCCMLHDWCCWQHLLVVNHHMSCLSLQGASDQEDWKAKPVVFEQVTPVITPLI